MTLRRISRYPARSLTMYLALLINVHGGSGDSWRDYTSNRTAYDDQIRDIRARRSSGSSSSEPYPGYARERAAEIFRQNHRSQAGSPVNSWNISGGSWEANQRRNREAAERGQSDAARAAADDAARTRALLKLYDAANAGDANALIEVAAREANFFPEASVEKYGKVFGPRRKEALWAAVRLIERRGLATPNSALSVRRRLSLEELSSLGDVVATRERALLSDIDTDPYVALQYSTKAAVAGDLPSQRRVVKIMATGHVDGVMAPADQVYTWCREAGESGYVGGQVLYACARFWGNGLEQNLPEAFGWFQKAIAADPNKLAPEEVPLRVKAMNLAGTMLLMGNGVKEDKPAGLALIEQAAHQGNEAAELNAGNCYLLGDGVKKNPHEAVRWFEIAAEHGSAEAACKAALVYFSPDEPVYDEAAGLRWIQRFSKRDPHAMLVYAEFIHDGRYGLRADPLQAKMLLETALENYPDEPEVLHSVGVLKLNGLNGFTLNPTEGVALLKRAYNQGSSASARTLQIVYARGAGVTANAIEADHWKELADAAGAPEIPLE